MTLRERISKQQGRTDEPKPVKRVPRWIERMQAGKLQAKDMTREPVL